MKITIGKMFCFVTGIGVGLCISVSTHLVRLQVMELDLDRHEQHIREFGEKLEAAGID